MSFEKIDKRLVNIKNDLIKITKTTSFKKKSEFKHILSSEEISRLKLNYAGIYLFEIKVEDKNIGLDRWKAQIKKKWDVKRLKLKHTPTTKKKRFEQLKVLSTWMPLYIGKSENIESRLNEHFHKKLTDTTFAMKLGIRKEFKDDTFKLSVIKLPVSNYDMIAPVVELHFRNYKNPIVGKQ